MIAKSALVVALWVAWTSLLLGGDGGDGSRPIPTLGDGATAPYSSIEPTAFWINDAGLDLASSYDPSCGAAIGCGDGCSDIDGTEHDSLLDPFLPRSHLPLPLLQSFAEERDVVLPLPLGASFVWTELNRNVAVSDVRLALGDDAPASVERINVPTSKFHASSQIARVDLWILPCFNLYALVGHTRSTGNAVVTIDRFPLPNSPPVTLDIPVDLSGTTGGWGATSGIGSKSWFAMLDVNQSWTEFSRLEGSLTALVVTPRVGLVINRPRFKGEIHTGAMWQDTAQTINLTIDHPALGNGLHVQVDQFEPRPCNFLVGGLWAIDERLQFFVEGGSGGRSYVVSGVAVRF